MFIGMLLLVNHVFSQRPVTGIWMTVNLPVRLSDKWQMHNDASYRSLGNSVYALQYLYRPGIRYNINASNSTAAGVAFFFTRTSFNKTNPEFGKEFRLWEEVLLQKNITKRGQWHNRFRIEQRFFKETSIKSSYNAYRFRLRTSFVQKLSDKWSLQFIEEYMQQLSHNKFQYDQNRLIISGNCRISSSAQIQAGYLCLIWPQNQVQHLLSIGFQKNISIHDNGNDN